ncbi:MAG: hypothetical protein EXX96DRAFT_471844 [Benjaminiella poitrasii]|nr:MAG: hypothetical protein EXX96DRAFT_471844 [Benjaminiella poitrasii]
MQRNASWPKTSNSIREQLSASKDECHLNTEKAFDDWEQTLKAISFQNHEETQKIAKMFTQVDTLSKNIKNSIERTNQALDQLLDKKLSILASVKDLNDIQSLLDLNTIVKNHWHHSST